MVDACEARGTFGPLALPIVYLQRHAVELIIKDLCRAAHEALDSIGEPQPRPDFDSNHRLGTWLERLQAALDAIGLPLPSSGAAVVETLKAIGDTDGQAWRYGRVKDKGVGIPAFPTEQTLPLREMQLKVEAFGLDAFENGSSGEGLFWDLGAISQDAQM